MHRPSGIANYDAMTVLVVRRRWRAIARLAAIWLVLSLWLSIFSLVGKLHAQTEGSLLEYQVKSAFLLNFTRFVEWPAAAFNAPDAPLTICVIGQDPFGAILDRTIEGESVNNRRIIKRQSQPDDDLRSCHLLFISRSERERSVQIISKLSSSSVLTVSELPGFAALGGMIEFVIEAGKTRFYINAATAEAAGLKLSSRLVRVAKEVKGS